MAYYPPSPTLSPSSPGLDFSASFSGDFSPGPDQSPKISPLSPSYFAGEYRPSSPSSSTSYADIRTPSPPPPPPPTKIIKTYDSDEDIHDTFSTPPSSSSIISSISSESSEKMPIYERPSAYFDLRKSPYKWSQEVKDMLQFFQTPSMNTFLNSEHIDNIKFIQKIIDNYEKGVLIYPYNPDNVPSLVAKIRRLKIVKESSLSPNKVPERLQIMYSKKPTNHEKDRINNVMNIHLILYYILSKLTDKLLEFKMKENRKAHHIPDQERYGYTNHRGEFVELHSVAGRTIDNERKMYIYNNPKYKLKYTVDNVDQPPQFALGYSPYVRSIDNSGKLRSPMPLYNILRIFFGVETDLNNLFLHHEILSMERTSWEIQEYLIRVLQKFFMPSKKWFRNQIDRLSSKFAFEEETFDIIDWKSGMMDSESLISSTLEPLFNYVDLLSPKTQDRPIVLFHGVSDVTSRSFLNGAFGPKTETGELTAMLATSWWPGIAMSFALSQSEEGAATIIRLFIRHPVRALFVSGAFASQFESLSSKSNQNEREIILSPGIYFRPRISRRETIISSFKKQSLDKNSITFTTSFHGTNTITTDYFNDKNPHHEMIPQIFDVENTKMNDLEIIDFETYDPSVESFINDVEVAAEFDFVDNQSQQPSSSSSTRL